MIWFSCHEDNEVITINNNQCDEAVSEEFCDAASPNAITTDNERMSQKMMNIGQVVGASFREKDWGKRGIGKELVRGRNLTINLKGKVSEIWVVQLTMT